MSASRRVERSAAQQCRINNMLGALNRLAAIWKLEDDIRAPVSDSDIDDTTSDDFDTNEAVSIDTASFDSEIFAFDDETPASTNAPLHNTQSPRQPLNACVGEEIEEGVQ